METVVSIQVNGHSRLSSYQCYRVLLKRLRKFIVLADASLRATFSARHHFVDFVQLRLAELVFQRQALALDPGEHASFALFLPKDKEHASCHGSGQEK
jgi:hypothetical protein